MSCPCPTYVRGQPNSHTPYSTHCVHDVQSGLVPEWTSLDAPAIAKDYWRLAPDAVMLDVLKAVRADEATHRFVNHTLADLDQAKDFNPFALAEPAPEVRGTKWGFTRDESREFVQEIGKQLEQQERHSKVHGMKGLEVPDEKGRGAG